MSRTTFLGRVRQFVMRASAALFRLRSYVIYSLDCSNASMPDPSESEVFHVLTADYLEQNQPIVDALCSLSPENSEYVADIKKRKIVGFLIESKGEIVHFAYLFLKNRTVCILGLDQSTALVGNAFTVPWYRGRGAQPRSVAARAFLAHQAGYRRILAETSPDNLASQRGMSKGGMQLLGRMDLLVAINSVVMRWRRPTGFPMFGFCTKAR